MTFPDARRGAIWNRKRADNGLARDLGALGAIATVIAGTLGAGLFVTIGTASSTTGPSVILVVIATGIVAMAIATNYSWMATIFPGAGGSYTYISRTFSARWAGFVVTWTKWLGYMAADAVLAIGFGSYLKVFFPAVDPPIAGFCLLTVLFLVNLVGTKSYSRSQNVIFVLLILSVLVLVIPGLFYIQPAHYRPFFTGGPSGFFAAAVPLFYAYIGIAVAAQMGAEVRNPGRNLPLAMAGGTAFLIVIYVLTAAVIYGIVGDYTVLANSDRPLATAAASFLGEYTTGIVAVGGLARHRRSCIYQATRSMCCGGVQTRGLVLYSARDRRAGLRCVDYPGPRIGGPCSPRRLRRAVDAGRLYPLARSRSGDLRCLHVPGQAARYRRRRNLTHRARRGRIAGVGKRRPVMINTRFRFVSAVAGACLLRIDSTARVLSLSPDIWTSPREMLVRFLLVISRASLCPRVAIDLPGHAVGETLCQANKPSASPPGSVT